MDLKQFSEINLVNYSQFWNKKKEAAVSFDIRRRKMLGTKIVVRRDLLCVNLYEKRGICDVGAHRK